MSYILKVQYLFMIYKDSHCWTSCTRCPISWLSPWICVPLFPEPYPSFFTIQPYFHFKASVLLNISPERHFFNSRTYFFLTYFIFHLFLVKVLWRDIAFFFVLDPQAQRTWHMIGITESISQSWARCTFPSHRLLWNQLLSPFRDLSVSEWTQNAARVGEMAQ